MVNKTWIITGEITQDDLEWVLRSKLSFVQGEQYYVDLADYTTTNRPMIIPGKREPNTIITTNDKEETWLKLYFSDKVMLMSVEHQFFQGY